MRINLAIELDDNALPIHVATALTDVAAQASLQLVEQVIELPGVDEEVEFEVRTAHTINAVMFRSE